MINQSGGERYWRVAPKLGESLIQEVDAWEAVQELDRQGWHAAGLEMPLALDPSRQDERRPSTVGLASWLLLAMAPLQGVAAVSLVASLKDIPSASLAVVFAATSFVTAIGALVCARHLALGRRWARPVALTLAVVAVGAMTLQPFQGHGLGILATVAWLLAGFCAVHPATSRYCQRCSGITQAELTEAA